MTNVSCIMLLTVLASCGVGGQTNPQFDGERALSYVAAQMEFGPRVPNTEGHRRAGDWIVEQLRARVDSVEVMEFTHVAANGDTLHLRNMLGRIQPQLTERVLFLAHWDTRPVADKSRIIGDRRLPVPGANDGASGVALLIAIADELREAPPTLGVDLLFVDGEDYGDFTADTDVLIGSRHFAANLPENYPPLFGVLFDMVGDSNLVLQKEWNSANRAPEVVDRVWRRAAELGYDDVFRTQSGGAMTDDHIPLLDAGVRTIDVIHNPLPPYHHTTDDTLDKISARSLAIVGDVALALVR